MRHVYECPVRWADLDMLNHVNNVTYVDYLQEARVDMLRTHAPDARAHDLAGSPTEGLVVVSHDIAYLAPIAPRTVPVKIEVWVTEIRAASVTMAYEIFDETESGDRVVHARASTVLTPFVFAEERPRRLREDEKEALAQFLEEAPTAVLERGTPRHLADGHYTLHVRFSDVDVYGHVNNVKYFEYFQEARIPVMDRISAGEDNAGVGIVIARKQVDYVRPIRFRAKPYDVWSWVSHVGRRSVTVESEICDGDTLLSRAKVVMVFFDPHTQRSAEPPAALMDRLREFEALEA
ncbi:thioesterase family protein [Nocardioides sp. Y6]|uniref:Thioesterase family protein n=1 Tax=Nocardioides malaquae TaxID=2773426 RepID=A0ABR9RU99_9ACTN|nr:thioesterase family protein [Nocardioides malaquae]